MDDANSLPAEPGEIDVEFVVFKLYISGNAPNSLRAIANLTAICQEYLLGRYRIEIIDSLQTPMEVLIDHIVLTPTLVKVWPPPSWQMYGDLSNKPKILLMLGSEGNPR